MSDPIDDYLKSLRRELGTIPDADDIVAEIDDHLGQAAAEEARRGLDPVAASEAAVMRLGTPAQVGRAVRTQRGRWRSGDPIVLAGWPFLVAEIMLIVGGLALATSAYLFWLPCGEFLAGQDGLRCYPLMDAGVALPAIPQDQIRLLAVHLAALIGQSLLGLGWAIFALSQPWRISTRIIALVPTALTLALATAELLAIGEPLVGDWADLPMVLLSLACPLAFGYAIEDPLPGLRAGRFSPTHLAPTTTYRRYLWRVALLALAINSAGTFSYLLDSAVMGGLTGADWDTPPGTGLISAASAVLFASASLAVGRRRNPKVTGENSPVTLGAVRY
ncbi:permease prefix domain 1-containing protein [Micropruina sp.]|uniref:permease prefix domain 1-containing protein n=1 Tax=Micropruina sp. TaxID=2737536 RepID=UPI0039E6F3F9